MAKKACDQIRTETLQVIEADPKRLAEVDGIGDKRIEMIKKAWDDQKEIREVMVCFRGMGSALPMEPKYTKNMERNPSI